MVADVFDVEVILVGEDVVFGTGFSSQTNWAHIFGRDVVSAINEKTSSVPFSSLLFQTIFLRINVFPLLVFGIALHT